MNVSLDSDGIHDLLGRAYFPLATLTVICALVGVWLSIGPKFAVFGMYALLGLLAGALVYYGTGSTDNLTTFHVDERLAGTGVYVTSALTIGLVALTGEPLLVVGGLLIGFSLIVAQLFASPTPERVLPQLTAVFLLSPLTKYLTSGQYIGHGDIVNHERFVSDILASGTVQALTYTSYRDFPGLQLIAATAGELSGLGPYDGIMMIGLATYAVLIPAIYLVTARLTDNPRLALFTAFAVALIDNVSFFASYVFPQSVATVLIVVLALLVILESDDTIKWPVAAAFTIIIVALSFTHHLTQSLFAPVLAVGLLVVALHSRAYARSVLFSRQFALVVFGGLVTGLQLFLTGFLDRLFENGARIIEGGLLGGYTESHTFGFGRTVWESSEFTALEWLAGPYGMYQVLLVFVFSLGIIEFFRRTNRTPAQAALFWTGAIGALIVFETPISVRSLNRMSFAWLFVFAFVLGLGMRQMARRLGTTRARQVLMAIVVILAVLGPVVTADNYYELDARPTVQSTFSDQEVADLQALSGYVTEKRVAPSSLWLTRLAVQRHTGTATRYTELQGETPIIPAGHFVYRTEWANHKVNFISASDGVYYPNRMYVSQYWITRRTAAGNKVYAAGDLGVLWRSTERPLEEQ